MTNMQVGESESRGSYCMNEGTNFQPSLNERLGERCMVLTNGNL